MNESIVSLQIQNHLSQILIMWQIELLIHNTQTQFLEKVEIIQLEF